MAETDSRILLDSVTLLPLLLGGLGADKRILLVGVHEADFVGNIPEINARVSTLDFADLTAGDTAAIGRFDTILVAKAPPPTRALVNLVSNFLVSDGCLVWVSERRQMTLRFLASNFWSTRAFHRRFSEIDAIAVFPSHERPREYFTLGASLASLMIGRFRPKLRSLLSLLLKKQSVMFVLRQPETKSILHSAVTALRMNTGSHLGVRRVVVSSTGMLIVCLRGHGQDYFVRFPLGRAASERARNNHDICKILETRPHGVRVPNPVQISSEPSLWVAETAIDGYPMEPKRMDDDHIANQFDRCLNAVSHIHLQFGQTYRCTETLFNETIQRKSDVIAAWLVEPSHIEKLNALTDFLRSQLIDKNLLVTLCHGDFKLENCTVARDGGIGIIDWDLGQERELAIVDISSAYCQVLRKKAGWSLPDVLTKIESVQTLERSLESYYEKTSADFIGYEVLRVVYWMDRVYKQLNFNDHVDNDWIYSNVMAVVSGSAATSMDQAATAVSPLNDLVEHV